ncbi:MAG: VWA domain-containing protein [Flavobacteriaceae bacterium]|nr:VWA domain-containing protein [Flavobacteriaceae bacterium]
MSTITILFIVIAAIIAFMMVFFQYYFKEKQRGKHLLVFAVLRFFTIFFMLVLFINPKTNIKQFEDIKPRLNILVDNSSSIRYSGQEEQVKSLLELTKNNKELNEKFAINYYAFSDQVSKQDIFNFDQQETNILKSLQSLEAINSEGIAPVVLITDGNQTQGTNYEFYRSKQQIYPVIVGDTLRYDDLQISQVNVNRYTTLNNKFPVEVFLLYDGNETINKTLTVRRNNTVVFSQTVQFTQDKNSQNIQFHLPASKVGIHHYNISIAPLPNEKNKLNNDRNFSIEVIDEQAKILIVSAINHPDIGMLKRSIEMNRQRKVDIINNLNTNIKLNEYQLVIIYQPNGSFNNIINDVLNTDTNIFVITGSKTDWKFLNQSQPFFKRNSINKTEEYATVFNLNFDEFILEDIGFKEYPPLEDYFGEIQFSVAMKPVLYQKIANYETEEPLLATFSMQNKRGAVLFGENIWKWRMYSKVTKQSFAEFDTFFDQLIQYLSSSKRTNRLEINYKPFEFANSKVLITSQYFDANYNFDKDALLELTITNNDTKTSKRIPFTLNNNNFQVFLSDLTAGNYSFNVKVQNQNITKAGSLTVLPYEVEQQFTTANIKDLKGIAEASGGSYFFINQTNDFIETLLPDKRFVTVQKSIEKTVSLIDWKFLLGLVLFLLSLEWFLRKYRGLI